MFPDPCLFSIQGEPGSPGQDGIPGLAVYQVPGSVFVFLHFWSTLKRDYTVYVSNGAITEMLNT